MQWEKDDGIWGADWKTATYAEIAGRYAARIDRRNRHTGHRGDGS